MFKRLQIVLFLSLLLYSFAILPAMADDWQVWKDCKLVEDEYMDGDSFYIERGPRSQYIIRLYFVDCPESDNRFPDRVAEQSKYFGISSEDALRVGKDATEFTRELLKDGFTVHTKMHKSYSASSKPRYYGFIEYKDGKYLAEALVENGLARIHGEPSNRPKGKSYASIYNILHNLEKEAKDRKLGAWRFNDEIKRSARVEIVEPEFDKGGHIITDRTIAVYSVESPHRFRGLLQSGAKLSLHELRENQYILVSFQSNGKEIRGLCLKRDLGM